MTEEESQQSIECKAAIRAALEKVGEYCGLGEMRYVGGASKQPIEYGLSEGYDVEEGTYSSEEFRKIALKTAEPTFEILKMERGLLPEDCEWQYSETTLEQLTTGDPFVATLIKYADVEPDAMMNRVLNNQIPEKDIDNLVYNWEKLGRERLAEIIRRNIERLRDSIAKIRESGVYYPPSVDERSELLDGGHRLAAIGCIYEPYQRIHYWKLQTK
jgi:hypothetical protein